MTDMRFFIWTFVLFIFDCFFLRLFLEFYPLVNANGFFIIFACTKLGHMAQFEIGNQAALKWNIEESEKAFTTMLENAWNNDTILCYNDACKSIGLRYTTAEYLCNKYTVLDDFKKDIQMAIVSRINEKSLTGEYSAAPSIWRMKQCGERDTSEINHQNNGGKFDQPRIVFKKSYDE